jgi:hypothetical protein
MKGKCKSLDSLLVIFCRAQDYSTASRRMFGLNLKKNIFSHINLSKEENFLFVPPEA